MEGVSFSVPLSPLQSPTHLERFAACASIKGLLVWVPQVRRPAAACDSIVVAAEHCKMLNSVSWCLKLGVLVVDMIAN